MNVDEKVKIFETGEEAEVQQLGEGDDVPTLITTIDTWLTPGETDTNVWDLLQDPSGWGSH